MNNNSAKSGGIGFVGLLTIAFIVLRLTGFISWSWAWVLSPIWITVIFVVVAFMVIILVLGIKDGIRKSKR